jgi:hypothetical protein
MSEQDLSLFPAWRQAVQDFLAEFKYGDLVPHDWLGSHFGMLTIEDGERLTAAAFKARQFAWLANIEAFKTELLTVHQVCLESVRGEGFRWVPPGEQTGVATRDFERDARKTFRAVGQRLKNVRLSELSDAQRGENTDAIAKISMLNSYTKRQLKLGR